MVIKLSPQTGPETAAALSEWDIYIYLLHFNLPYQEIIAGERAKSL